MRTIVHEGKTLPLARGVLAGTFRRRVAAGHDPEVAASTPLGQPMPDIHGTAGPVITSFEGKDYELADGITRTNFLKRMRREGISPEEAASRPLADPSLRASKVAKVLKAEKRFNGLWPEQKETAPSAHAH